MSRPHDDNDKATDSMRKVLAATDASTAEPAGRAFDLVRQVHAVLWGEKHEPSGRPVSGAGPGGQALHDALDAAISDVRAAQQGLKGDLAKLYDGALAELKSLHAAFHDGETEPTG